MTQCEGETVEGCSYAIRYILSRMDRQIRGYGIIFKTFQTSVAEFYDVTGRVWGQLGDWVVCYRDWRCRYINRLPELRKLKNPVPFKGFQGIMLDERG